MDDKSLKQTITSLIDKFFQLFMIDVLINLKKAGVLFFIAGLSLLFCFTTWVILLYGLYNYLLSQHWGELGIFCIVILLNLIGLVGVVMWGKHQFKSLKFNYTQKAIRKIKTSLEVQDESE